MNVLRPSAGGKGQGFRAWQGGFGGYLLPGEIEEVEGKIVGLRERVEVHVVVAKQVVATERA